MADKKCWSCGAIYDGLACPICEAKKIARESHQARIRKTLTLSTIALLAVGLISYSLIRKTEDDKLHFGEHAFVVITQADRYDSSNFLMKGVVGFKEGKSTANMPGAVLVVGVPEGIKIGGKSFSYRQIILLNSKGEYVLAPPGTILTVPPASGGLIPMSGIRSGTMVVPGDSRIPE